MAQIQIDPAESLVGQPVRIRATGLHAGSKTTLRIERTDNKGIRWESQATFVAGNDGVVDPAAQPPLSGGYSGVDPAGLFWTLKPTSTAKPSGAFGRSLDPERLTASLEVGGQRAASTEFIRLRLARGVERIEVRQEGVVGTLFLPAGTGISPAIIVLGGSEGGVFEPAAAQYAARGYVTFALGYFGMEGLPDDLQAALRAGLQGERPRD